MALFGGLFGSKEAHPQLARVVESLRTHLGLELTAPAPEVVDLINRMTSRELLNFDNLHSIEGMQELFRAKSIRALVEPGTQKLTLVLAAGEDLARQIREEHAQHNVIQMKAHRPAQATVKPPAPTPTVEAAPSVKPLEAVPLAPVPPAFEHLEGLEHLLPPLVDLFVRHGQLNTGDKEVLKHIHPTDGSLEARIVALERWEQELTRRVRGLHVPKIKPHLLLRTEATAEVKPEEELARRFDALVHWVSKLIKAFEHTRVKFPGKPMWLPH